MKTIFGIPLTMDNCKLTKKAITLLAEKEKDNNDETLNVLSKVQIFKRLFLQIKQKCTAFGEIRNGKDMTSETQKSRRKIAKQGTEELTEFVK